MRLYWTAFALLVTLHVAIVWGVDVLPGNDFPQHLAMARILRDHSDNSLLFAHYYEPPTQFQTYFISYYLLAWLGSIISMASALKLVISGYVVAMFLAIHFLVTTCHGDREERTPPWTALLATHVIWSPAACLGLLQFMLTAPIFVLGWAFLMRWLRERSRWPDGLACATCAATLATLHLVPAITLVVGGVFLAWCERRRRAFANLALPAAVVCVTVFLWGLGSSVGLQGDSGLNATDAMRTAVGLNFVDDLFGIEWSSPPMVLTFVLWTLLGPFRWAGQGLVVVAFVLAAVAGSWRPSLRGSRAVVAITALACLAPWSISQPTEITFLNLRLMSLCLPLLLTLVSPRTFALRRAHLALIAFAVFLTAHVGYRAIGFSREARPMRGLLDAARPTGVMQSLVFHNTSTHFGKAFRLTHFLPMYYTIEEGGINTQFWARMTHHLPFSYKQPMQPAATADWAPWEFRVEDLRDSNYLLVQYADAEDGKLYYDASERIRRMLHDHVTLIRCDGTRWCLYTVRPVPAGP